MELDFLHCPSPRHGTKNRSGVCQQAHCFVFLFKSNLKILCFHWPCLLLLLFLVIPVRPHHGSDRSSFLTDVAFLSQQL